MLFTAVPLVLAVVAVILAAAASEAHGRFTSKSGLIALNLLQVVLILVVPAVTWFVMSASNQGDYAVIGNYFMTAVIGGGSVLLSCLISGVLVFNAKQKRRAEALRGS